MRTRPPNRLGQSTSTDDTVSDDENPNDVVSDDEDLETNVAPESPNFSQAQLKYIHSLIGATSLYYRAQKVLFRECNRLRRFDGIPQDMVKEVKALLRNVGDQTKLAEDHLRPFARTRHLIVDQELEIPSSTTASSEIDKGIFPVPFAGAVEDPDQ